MSDERWLQAAKLGHPAAFATLCQRYSQRVLRSTHRITRNREDAEDAVQDALLRAFLHIGQFNGRSSFGTWLTRIAINSALMMLRKKRTSREVAMEDDDEEQCGLARLGCPIADPAPNPERRCAEWEQERILNEAVQNLRPPLRQAVKIWQLEDHSIRYTAKCLGISPGAAKARLFRARVALRRSSILNQVHRPDIAV